MESHEIHLLPWQKVSGDIVYRDGKNYRVRIDHYRISLSWIR